MNEPQRFQEIIQHGGPPLISDGAMGTLLNARGISFEQSFDSLNLINPALVAQIHREYIDAGSTMIQTNTFSANRFKLALHGQEHLLREINKAGVELARRVVLASFKDVLIAGDIGPLGVRLAPFGRVQPEQAYQVFSEQISSLAEAGVDLLIIETMTDLFELDEAIRAAREAVGPDFPLMEDAAGMYDYLTAIAAGQELQRLGYTWFEEPIPDRQGEQLRRLADQLPAGERRVAALGDDLIGGVDKLTLRVNDGHACQHPAFIDAFL